MVVIPENIFKLNALNRLSGSGAGRCGTERREDVLYTYKKLLNKIS